jgi:HEAT repeat protein
LERALAAVRLAEAGDAGAVHELVDLLEDSDRAVRMYAILALVRLTGADYGYTYYGSDLERAVAVRRWREALRAGEVVVRPRAAVPEGAPDAPQPNDPSVSAPTADDQERASGLP